MPSGVQSLSDLQLGAHTLREQNRPSSQSAWATHSTQIPRFGSHTVLPSLRSTQSKLLTHPVTPPLPPLLWAPAPPAPPLWSPALPPAPPLPRPLEFEPPQATNSSAASPTANLV